MSDRLPPVASSAIQPTVVLSAGGPVAWMFHLGVLSALESHGWDLADCHMVGTSAGSAVAASVKSGASLDQVHAAMVSSPTDHDPQAIFNTLRAAGRTITEGKLRDRVRPLAPRFVRQALPGGRGIAMALAGALPSGIFPTDPLNALPSVTRNDHWPARLWIPAVDAATGNVTVFGRDASEATVADAVEASSAVPGVFQPKELDGREYIDGAVSSSTHAALAAELSPGVVVVSSVQTRAGRRPVRIGARRRLANEVRVLEARGIQVLTIEPDEQTMAVEPRLLRPGFPGADELREAGQRLATEALAERAPGDQPTVRVS